MTLTEKQAGERAKLARLLAVLDRREPTWDSLKRAMEAAISWGDGDHTPHMREALRHYLREESNVKPQRATAAKTNTQNTDAPGGRGSAVGAG